LAAPDNISDVGRIELSAVCIAENRHHLGSIADLQSEIAPQPVARVQFDSRQCR
jgi:hypothetical protein